LSEENKAIAQKFVAAVNERNLDALEQLFSPEFVNHSPRFGFPPNAAGYRQNVGFLLSAFPDAILTAEDIISEGDKVVLRTTLRGTHDGALLDKPPTGKKISIEAINIWRTKEGQILERWEQADLLGLMRQLGGD